jgi:hypothetical protein
MHAMVSQKPRTCMQSRGIHPCADVRAKHKRNRARTAERPIAAPDQSPDCKSFPFTNGWPRSFSPRIQKWSLHSSTKERFFDKEKKERDGVCSALVTSCVLAPPLAAILSFVFSLSRYASLRKNLCLSVYSLRLEI